MRLRKLGIGLAIIPTLAFSCHNEPNYARVGMNNPPSGSGNGTAPPVVAAPPAAAAPAAAAAKPATPAKPAAKK